MSLEAFEACAAEYDRAVARADIVDRFCSLSDWVVPAKRAFHPDVPTLVYRMGAGWVPLMTFETTLGRTWMPLEASWGLASALVSEEPARLSRQFAQVALENRDAWDALFLTGLKRGGRAFTQLVHAFGRGMRLGLGKPTVRYVASLEGGMDGWLGRRTRTFRKNLRAAARKCPDTITFSCIANVPPDAVADLFTEVMSVEAKSWKGQSGVGVAEGPMRAFYAEMVPRLASRGALRITTARDPDGLLIGFVLGGLLGTAYRGLQISYADSYRHLSLGNLLQRTTIEGLASEGVLSYDLGTEKDYKRFWAEEQRESVPLVIR